MRGEEFQDGFHLDPPSGKGAWKAQQERVWQEACRMLCVRSCLRRGDRSSLLREMSDPAQPPTEGAEGAEGTAPGGGPPGPPPNTTSNRRLQQTQAQVEEVVDIMRVNVDKVLKRDEILSELDDRADALQMGASQFESSAAKLKRKYWWKNCKMMIMLGAICAIIVVVIARWD
uniref:Vesicle associated membrane protein 1 n=1 Tax=Pipistrellus kuhlii TaxID=59472 RepID=A0A7J7ZPW3_PIPKU|nr:vesicle associated membrane protein 1 [Pipistrellus kuhlii]